MGTHSKIPLSIEGGTLAQYLEELSHLKPLTREEEQRLCSRIREGDEEAKAHLIQANLRFVVTIAKKYLHHGMPLSDLISEGNLGLIRAVDLFDPTRGHKFISYAVWWIRSSILCALANRSRPVRLPQNQVQMLHHIFQTSRRLEQEIGRRPTSTEIARQLDVSPEQVDRILGGGRRHRSLDAPLYPDDDLSLLDRMNSGEPTPDEDAVDGVLHREIQGVLGALEDREAEVIRLYYGLEGSFPMTLEEIAQRYGLTRERVRQIKEKALGRLRHPSRAHRLKVFWEHEE